LNVEYWLLKYLKILLYILAFSLLFCAAATAQENQYYENPPQSEEGLYPLPGKNSAREVQLDSLQVDSTILALMVTQHVPGVSCLIIKDGGIYWQNQYGFANIEQNRPTVDSTLFMLASVSKPSTGTALMQLWEQGYFGLDDNINDYLPYSVVNPYQTQVTLTFRMLLTHTSTIMDNWTILDPLPAPGDPTIPLDEFTSGYLVPGGTYYSSSNYYPGLPPGQVWSYTNVGVTLIGYLVEQISGMTFEEYCQENIFLPLGMNESSWFIANLDTNNIAMLYEWNGIEFVPYGHMGRPWYPAGQLRTSAPQLARFLQAYMQGGIIDTVRILETSTVDSMLTLQCPEIADWQGLIWNYEYKAQHWTWGHGGNSWGTRTVMSFCPDDNIGVIVLSNGESNYLRDTVETLLYQFARANAGVNPALPAEIPTSFSLSVYPNPFNSVVNISFNINSGQAMKLIIYNQLGQQVSDFEFRISNLGENSVVWDADGVSSGVYFVRLTIVGGQSLERKVVLMK